MCVRRFFPNYFCGINADVPGRDAMNQFMDVCNDEIRLAGFLQDISDHDNLIQVLDMVDAVNMKCTERQAQNILIAYAFLLDSDCIGGYGDKEVADLFLGRHFTLYDRISASIRYLATEHWPDIGKRSEIIVNVVKQSESLEFAARCLVTMRESSSVSLYKLKPECLVDESSRHWMFEWLIDRIERGGRSVWSGGDVFAKRKAWCEGVGYSKDEQHAKLFKQQFIADVRNKSSDLRAFYVALWPFVEVPYEVLNDKFALTFKFREMNEFGDLESLANALAHGDGNSLLCRMFAELMDFKAEQERASVNEFGIMDLMKAWDLKEQAKHMREVFPGTVIEQAVANGTFV